MIITPNSVMDSEHMIAFQDEFAKYNSTPGEESSHWGSGELEHYEVVVKKIRTLQGNGLYVVVSNGREGILICRLISAPVVPGSVPWGRKVYVMDSIRIHEDYVGRGIAPAVYRWLVEHGYTIVSDSHQTGNSLAVWKKLAKMETVFMYNMEDNTWRNYNPMTTEDWVLFGNNDLRKNWNIRFVIPAKS
jgi:hypothetical protein